METRESAVITFRVTPDEFQTIETKAAEAGVNRADYVRSKALAPDHSERIAQLEQQLNALTDRLGEVDPEKPQCNHRCNNPEHANVWGVGYCFDCDMPMRSSH